MADITIICSELEFDFSITGTGVTAVVSPSDPFLATYFDCNEAYGEFDEYGNPIPPLGRLYFSFGILGDLADTYIVATVLTFDFDISGEDTLGILGSGTVLSFNFRIRTDGAEDSSNYIHIGSSGLCKVIWSKIGSLDFTIDHSNEAGEGYLKELGILYSLCKLGNKIAAYGRDCVGVLTPNQTAWGFTKLSEIGVIGRNAQVGTNEHHWYIDTNSDLCELFEGVKVIGYREFLSTLTNPVMILDKLNKFIYICDGTYGFVFSYDDYSLGAGGVNISGYGYKGNAKIVCSPEAVEIPTITFTTEILDMQTRKEKTIFNIEVATDTPNLIEAAIDYRLSQDGEFSSTPWTLLTPRGIAYLPCYGIEFKVKLRMATWADFAIDQMKINGVIHGFSYLDSLERNY